MDYYLKERILFEIQINPQARSIMCNLNDSCWSNISTQEHWFKIQIILQTRLIMSSLNDSTCNLNYIELQKKLSHWLKKAQMHFLYYIFQVYSQIQHTWLYSFIYPQNKTINGILRALYILKIKLLKAF